MCNFRLQISKSDSFSVFNFKLNICHGYFVFLIWLSKAVEWSNLSVFLSDTSIISSNSDMPRILVAQIF